MCTEWHTITHCKTCSKDIQEYVNAEICSNRRPNGVWGECSTGPMTKYKHNFDIECFECKEKREAAEKLERERLRLAAIKEETEE